MRVLLDSSILRIAALVWLTGFFVVFVPAHRRGVVALPGQAMAQAGEAPYCPLCTVPPPASGGRGDAASTPPAPWAPPADAPVNCGVCHLRANLDQPPAVIVPPTFVAELAFLLFEPRHLDVAALEASLDHPARGPPRVGCDAMA